jgi:hypothetical protein
MVLLVFYVLYFCDSLGAVRNAQYLIFSGVKWVLDVRIPSCYLSYGDN